VSDKQVPHSDLLLLAGDSEFDRYDISISVELAIGPKIKGLKWVYFLESETPATDDACAIVECDLGAEDSELDGAMELYMIEMFGGSVLHIIISDLIRLLLTIHLYQS
jgi:hypothetical protein